MFPVGNLTEFGLGPSFPCMDRHVTHFRSWRSTPSFFFQRRDCHSSSSFPAPMCRHFYLLVLVTLSSSDKQKTPRRAEPPPLAVEWKPNCTNRFLSRAPLSLTHLGLLWSVRLLPPVLFEFIGAEYSHTTITQHGRPISDSSPNNNHLKAGRARLMYDDRTGGPPTGRRLQRRRC